MDQASSTPADEPAEPAADAPVSADATALAEPKSAAAFEMPRELPPYSKSLLRIQVPVIVSLATKKLPVQQIVEIGVGSIIKFEKSCDELLDLQVNNCTIARGEA